MSASISTECELSFVLRCGDDEEQIGHVIGRLTAHLRDAGGSFELLVVDEGSGDNTLAVAALLRTTMPELVTLHAGVGRGFVAGAERARGRFVAVLDARHELPLSSLGFALGKLERGSDVVTVGDRLLVFRRTRCLRALEALAAPRRAEPVRFVKRARALKLGVVELHPRRHPFFERLREVLHVPSTLPFRI